ncbi:MAG: hypothetical protein ACI9D5_002206 [Candidatus Endobugula sp.]|jgi:hypothetical protein
MDRSDQTQKFITNGLIRYCILTNKGREKLEEKN